MYSLAFTTCPIPAEWCKSINYKDQTCSPQYCQLYGANERACEQQFCTAHPNDKSCPKYCKSVNKTDPDCPGYCDTPVGEADTCCVSHCQTKGADDPNCPQYCQVHPTDQACACKANPDQKICNGWYDVHPDDKADDSFDQERTRIEPYLTPEEFRNPFPEDFFGYNIKQFVKDNKYPSIRNEDWKWVDKHQIKKKELYEFKMTNTKFWSLK